MNAADDSTRRILLRGLLLVPLCYATVQVVQLLAGNPYEWFGLTQFFGAVFLPVFITAGTLIQNRRSHEHR